MDIKQFVGKDVAIQFKPGIVWYVHAASHLGTPLCRLQPPPKNGLDPVPVVSPFLMGQVLENGAVRICTDVGGELDVLLDSDSIFAVMVVHKSAESEMTPFGPAPKRENDSLIVNPN